MIISSTTLPMHYLTLVRFTKAILDVPIFLFVVTHAKIYKHNHLDLFGVTM